MGAGDDNNMLPLYIGGGLLLFGGFLQLLILVLIPLCLDEDDWKVAYEFDAIHVYSLTPQNSKLKDNKTFIQNYKKQVKNGQNVQEGAQVKDDDVEVYEVSDCANLARRQLSVDDESRQLFEEAMGEASQRRLSARDCETVVKSRINIKRKDFDKIYSELQLIHGVKSHLEENVSTKEIKTTASAGSGAESNASVVTDIRLFSRPDEEDDFKDLLEDDTLYSNKIKKHDVYKTANRAQASPGLAMPTSTAKAARNAKITAYQQRAEFNLPQRDQNHPRNKDRKGEKYEKDDDDYNEGPGKGEPDCNPMCEASNTRNTSGLWGKCPSAQATAPSGKPYCHPNKYKWVAYHRQKACTVGSAGNTACQAGGRNYLTCVSSFCKCTVGAQCGQGNCQTVPGGTATSSGLNEMCRPQTCDPDSSVNWATTNSGTRNKKCKLASDRCDPYAELCYTQQTGPSRRLLTKLMDEHNRNLRGEGFTPVEAN